MFCFHLSNATILPLLSQRAQKLGIDSSGAYAAATIIIAQSTMIIASLVCLRLLGEEKSRDLGESNADLHNSHAQREFKLYFWLFFACFFALIIRGGIAANFAGIGGMIFTQILDGVGGYFAQVYGYFSAYLFLGAVATAGLGLWIVGAKIIMRKSNA